MSERERWIVYPLLFLALGAALRDKLSEETRTKRIECQELIVNGENRVGQEPVTLVRIGAVPRTSASAPHVGQILIKGQLAAEGIIQAQVIQADAIQARTINADNYFYHRVPFAPTLLRAVPAISPWLRGWQQSNDVAEGDAPLVDQPTDGDNPPQPQPEAQPAEAPPADGAEPKAAASLQPK